MATVRLKPSTFTRSNTSYLTLSNEANIIDNDDTTYGNLQHSSSNTTAYYLYCGGFDFSSIPSNATITSVTLGVIAQVKSASASQKPTLCNNTTSVAGTLGSFDNYIETSKTTSTLNISVTNFNTFKGYGNNAGIRLCLNSNNQGTASNMQIYEVYINVNYTEPSLKNIKVGNTTINKMYIGDSEVKKIYIGTTLVYSNS